jgi:chromosome condensin MukBEF complex kleisin-like MukF subunit
VARQILEMADNTLRALLAGVNMRRQRTLQRAVCRYATGQNSSRISPLFVQITDGVVSSV